MSCHNTTPRIAVLLYILLAACHIAQADYRIFLNLNSVANPNNAIASGACCDQSSCQQPCNVMLRFCFRDSGHPREDLNSSCALAQFNRTNPGTTIADLPMESVITGPYSGQFQLYIRVSHRDSEVTPNFTPPFTDDLIDNIFIETNLDSHPFEDRGSNNLRVRVHEESGGRTTINLGLAVYCAENFWGPDCNCQDTDDVSGHFTCDRNGIKTCNNGYIDPATNCTQCIPADGCSITGGFCVPGECSCIDGYIGDNCGIRDIPTTTTSDTPTAATSTTANSDINTAATSTTDINTDGIGGSTEDNSVAIIAGSVAGGAAALILIAVIIVVLVAFVLARRKRRQGKWTPKGYQPTGLQQYPQQYPSDVDSFTSEDNQSIPEYATVQKPKKNLNNQPPPIPPFQGDNIMYNTTGETIRSQNMYITGETIRSEKTEEGIVFENAGISGGTVNDSEDPQEYEEVRFNAQQEKGVAYADLELPKGSRRQGGKISDVTYSEVEY